MVLTNDYIILRTKPIYQNATRKEKKTILDVFSDTFQKSRKHLITVLNSTDDAYPKSFYLVGRPKVYTQPVIDVVVDMWKRLGYPSSRIFKAQIPLVIAYYEKDFFRLSNGIREKVLNASERTLERMIKPYRDKLRPKGRSTTKSSKHPLRRKIPVRTEQWRINTPGYIEGDLVSHCGGKASDGHFYTLNTTDIATQWFSARILSSKRDKESLSAMKSIEHYLPFDMKGIDTDNGSEFINERWVNEFSSRLEFTRSRPYKKNDNAHIEQKNWQNIRRYLAYGRFDDECQFKLLDSLLRNELSDFLNFFVPVQKATAKERIGTKTRTKRDAAKTPYQRVLESSDIPQENKDFLRKRFKKLNPFLLQKQIWNTLKKIYELVPPAAW